MTHDTKTIPPRALTIAGSDSSGGAGIEADLKTFTALGVYGSVALTSVTAQNTVGVHGVHDLPPDFVAQQIDVVLEDIGTDVVKSGMLSNIEIIEAVADRMKEHEVERYVLDPVMVSESGHALLRTDAVMSLTNLLLPLATIVTPNLSEAEALYGHPVSNEAQMRDAAKAIHGLGSQHVLIKGGHLLSDDALDVLYDGDNFHIFSIPRIDTTSTHGTGCTYAAAIAAYLARGESVLASIERAKIYLTGALRNGFDLGEGAGPLNHFWAIRPDETGGT